MMPVMRRLSLLFFLLIGFAGIVSVSAKTVQERRAERLLRLQAAVQSPASSVSSVSSRVPILVYHHIRTSSQWGADTWSAKMSVSPAAFAAQMQWIEDHGYTPVTMDDAAAILKGEYAGPAKPLVITFDDDNRTAYTEAFPILKEHGFTAVFYLVTNRLDNKSFIVRSEVQEMLTAGMDIQSHTVTHSTLTDLSAQKLAWDLTESKRLLDEFTGKPVRSVAYPSTAHNKTVRDAAKAAGYVTGTIMDPRASTAKDDLFKLPRIMMRDDTKLAKVLP
jgi:peptidoglycan/xylan/chitin deacetylase (PgdA/CDA1 family)